jgi:4-hydroxyproline epimerase
MIEKRRNFLAEHDWIRKGLMFEPRGHDIMSGSILYPPTRDDCDAAILFIETSGCLPMCGHGTIGTVTMAIENGLIAPKLPAWSALTRRPASSSPSTGRRAPM